MQDILKVISDHTELIFVNASEASTEEKIWYDLVTYILKSFFQ